MTKATTHPAPDPEFDPVPWPSAAPLRLVRRGTGTALGRLFIMELDRQCRSRRMLVVLLLFALPVLFAVLARTYSPDDFSADEVEVNLVFYFIPHALVPLTALMYASGMVQDEVEEQTLTYLLVRPLPRWAIYACKLMATIVVTTVLVGLFTAATEAAIYWGTDTFWSEIVASRLPKTVLIIALSLLTYCSLFGCLSLFIKRAMAVGVAYIVVFEGVIANIDFVARRATVMYYFRVLSERWLELNVSEWAVDLNTAPSARACVLTLAGASLVVSVLAASAFSVREFRVKTPEGS